MGVKTIVKIRQIALWGISHWEQKADDSSMQLQLQGNQSRDVYSNKTGYIAVTKAHTQTKDPRQLKICCLLHVQEKVTNLSVEETIAI
ncbi:hypothetical protein Tco_0067034 [Tanacetum coccineum]